MTFRKIWSKPQIDQLASKFLIFKLAENYHGAHFHMWGRHPNAYVLYIFEKEVLSGSTLSSELASKNGHISRY